MAVQSDRGKYRIDVHVRLLPDTYDKLRSLADASGRTLGDTIDALISGCEEVWGKSSSRSMSLKELLEKYRDALISRLLSGEYAGGSICLAESLGGVECYLIDFYTRNLLAAIAELMIRGRVKPRDLLNLRPRR